MTEREPIPISELQHFAYCRRQWALIHVERQWRDNVRTIEGELMHQRAHDEKQTELRGDVLTMRGLRVFDDALGVSGVCDVVEFHRRAEGVPLPGYAGFWQPYPVEYKRGAPKEHDADELQLCCQAMCLEHMLLCEIPEGSLYYGETRRRQRVAFTPELRQRVREALAEMRAYDERGYTPRAKPTKGCQACSLKEICLPGLAKTPDVAAYLRDHMGEDAL